MTVWDQPNYLNPQGIYTPCVSDPSRQSGNHEWQGVLLTMIFIGCCCCCAAGDSKVENIANCLCSPCILIGNCCEKLTNLCKSLGEKVCNTFGRESEPLPHIVAELVHPTGLPGPLQMPAQDPPVPQGQLV